ncbi:MAG: 50S ribosomal protein L18 [Gemmataceae bacterium]|nr:50S ribosomal protein L18 [Gemmataceae bacterium]
MDAQKLKAARAQRRRFRVRKNIYGTPDQPRLSVFRSNLHIYAQLVDDLNGVTLAAAGSTAKAAGLKHGGNVAAASEVGRLIAAKAKEKGITRAAFDRGSYRFHGRVAALAQAATAAGLVCTGAAPVHKHKDAAPPADAKAAKGGKGEAKKGEGKPKGDGKKPGGDKK